MNNIVKRKAEYIEKKYLVLRKSGINVREALLEANKAAQRIFGQDELNLPDPNQTVLL